MSVRDKAIAELFRRKILDNFAESDRSPRLRVTCIEHEAIVALVDSLRGWRPPGSAMDARVVVTARGPKVGLQPEDLVPRGDESPTTLRNQAEVPVVLIEADDYSDRQSWQSIRAVSDASVLDDASDRSALVTYCFGSQPPGVLVSVLETVHDAVRESGDDFVSVRQWVHLVCEVCESVRAAPTLDGATAWRAVGLKLPRIGLFPDGDLASVPKTDQRRRLVSNRRDSQHLLADADDRWRDALKERAEQTRFVDFDTSRESAKSIQSDALELLGVDGARVQARFAFKHWLQLTQGKPEKRGLGTRLREHLEEQAPDRVSEYDELGVAEGVDAGDEQSARVLLEAEPAEGRDRALVTVFTSKQVAALERVAKPTVRATRTPLASVLQILAGMVEDRETVSGEADAASAAVMLSARRPYDQESEHSSGLFAWLFGPTFRYVAESTPSFRVDPSLLDATSLHGFELKDRDEDENDASMGNFQTLELKLHWSDGAGLEHKIDWDPRTTPGFVALWRLAGRPEVSRWDIGNASFDSWIEGSMQRTPLLGAQSTASELSEVAREWGGHRKVLLEEVFREGLSAARLADYAALYEVALRRLRADYVPMGAPRFEVDEMLQMDTLQGTGDLVLLASHPLRLRWISAYLREMQKHLRDAVEGALVTNPVNPDIFFDHLLAMSPQGQPPVLVSNSGDELHVAIREQDWHEHFAVLRDARAERRDWLADLDDGAIDDVGDVVTRYLDAYPHKEDSLHLLYAVRRNGARGLKRLVKHVSRRIALPGASIVLVLFVDPGEIRAVEEVLQEFDDADHRAHSGRPPIEVLLHRWENPEERLPDLSNVPANVDVAVVPNLFGASTRTHIGTRDSRAAGAFEPLYDQPSRLESVGSSDGPSAAVSRILLPTAPDALLQDWSTLVTRQFRGSPISESPTENDVDHATIQVSLDKNRAFFDELHRCAHWVVTVDAFVGREQIEALENGPDVIRVKTGVGANGTYRLVVSSKTGRRFVEARLARRLRQQLHADLLPNPEAVARALYDRARLLVPGIVLRSLALGRTAAELVGLVLARARIEEIDPARVGRHGFQAWLSLDDHPEWSGGHQSHRADLARIRGRLDGDVLYLRVDVVEAKMRTEVAVARADAQLARSIRMLRAALSSQADGQGEYADTRLWRRLIWRAIEQSSVATDGTPAATHVVTPLGPRAGLDEPLRAGLRQRTIVIEEIRGVLVSMTNDKVGSDVRTPAGHSWLRMTLPEVSKMLDRLVVEQAYPLVADLADATEVTPPPVEPAQPAPEPQPTAVTLSSPPSNLQPERGGATDAARRRMQELVDALFKRGVNVSAAGSDDALEGPGFFLLRVRLGDGVKPQALFALADDLQYQLALDAGRTPRMYVDRGTVVVEIPKRDEERYYISARDLWDRTEWPKDELYAPLGCDVRNEPVGINFSSSRSPHLLIGGMTGGGKSVALETLLAGLVAHYPPDRLEIRIVDPKGNEFTQFEDCPHVREVPGGDADDAIEMLNRTCEEMDGRYNAMKELSRARKERVRDIASYNSLVDTAERLPWILVVLDEFADLTSDRENKKVIEGLLQRIAQKARACGIHAVVATQKPSAEVISTTTRSNLGAQLALRVRSAVDSRVIMEATGAESLAGNGDGFLRLSGEEPIRLQCASIK